MFLLHTFEYTLLHQLFRLWSVLKLLLKAVGTHMSFELALMALEGRSSGGIRKDIAYVEH